MEANLAAFAERAGVAVRYGCTWTGTRVEERAGGTAFIVETSDGEYRCRVFVLAVGVAEPHVPDAPGIELAHHYGEVKPVEAYAGKRVFILGKQNSGFELASALLPWARQIVLSSPSPTSLSVDTRSLVGVRARYVQPYEDHVLGGGVSVLDASIGSIERLPEGVLRAHLHRSDGGGELAIDADEVIAATGFTAPLLDLPKLGCQVFGASRLPVQTSWWESATLPGVFFAGTIGQGARGLRKHGIPANSGAVHGARYNARVLARRLAEDRFGIGMHRPVIEPETLIDFLTSEIAEAPELFHQRAYLARVVTADATTGLRDSGVQPLAHALDEGGGGRDHRHARGRRERGDLPGPLHAHRRGGQRTRAGARSAAPLRHAGDARGACRARRTRAPRGGTSGSGGIAVALVRVSVSCIRLFSIQLAIDG